MPMLEGKVDHVVGVDTHRDAHTAAILDRNGGLITQLEVPSSQAGYAELLGVVAERAHGRRCWALEGTGCYGAGLASFLADHGEWVTEIDREVPPLSRRLLKLVHWTRQGGFDGSTPQVPAGAEGAGGAAVAV